MGLDMYFYASKHSSTYYDKDDCVYPKDLHELEEKIKQKNFVSMDAKYQIGYWRKFNALHGYIINNFADCIDDCRDIYLSRNNVKQLLSVCKEVLEDLETCPKVEKDFGVVYASEKAKKLLPPFEGFFFGSYAIDDWYKKDLEYTIDLLEEALKLDDKYEFYYNASW